MSQTIGTMYFDNDKTPLRIAGAVGLVIVVYISANMLRERHEEATLPLTSQSSLLTKNKETLFNTPTTQQMERLESEVLDRITKEYFSKKEDKDRWPLLLNSSCQHSWDDVAMEQLVSCFFVR